MNSMHDILRATGGIDEIYKAMDTYDMVKIVNASAKAIERTGYYNLIGRIEKSKIVSNAHRNTGNRHYQAGKYRLAIISYNMALAFAPKNSEEMKLALGNRSAVFFSIRYFSGCLKDIDSCLKMECNKDLSKRLSKRRKATIPQLHEEITRDMIINDIFVVSLLDVNCSISAEVQCASSDVSFIQNGVKRVTAGKDIKCGSLLANERAYATCKMSEETNYLSCYHCNIMALCLIPCKGCCEAMFCSRACQDDCNEEYHRIECQIIGLWPPTYKSPDIELVTRTVIKMSLKIGWNALIAASKDIGASRFKTSSVTETYDPREPLSILSYNDEYGDRIVEGRMFNGSLLCALVLHWLGTVSGYFPKEFSKRQSAKEAMARIMLRLFMTFNNKVPILCSSFDFKHKTYKYNAQTNFGWFSMTSKLKHSCEPNLMVVGLNDSVGLVALRSIKAGEELTISFIEYFYDIKNHKLDHMSYRANRLYILTRMMCNCRVCSQNWDVNSVINLKTTDRDTQILSRIGRMKYDQDIFRDICEMLDTFPINTVQHQKVYWALRRQMIIMQYKYTANKSYVEAEEI